jgi:hypothetical protein
MPDLFYFYADTNYKHELIMSDLMRHLRKYTKLFFVFFVPFVALCEKKLRKELNVQVSDTTKLNKVTIVGYIKKVSGTC